MGEKAVDAKLAEFINSWPLYSPFDLVYQQPCWHPDLPETILRDCPTCDATPTWARATPTSAQGGTGSVGVGVGSVIAYLCTHCKKQSLRLWFTKVDTNASNAQGEYSGATKSVFRKLGQWPAQSTEPDPEVAKALSKPMLEVFKKGLTSLGHGYGLGALAYFRRVVEDASTQLIDLFADRAAADGDDAAADAIRAAKSAQHMEDRLRAAADALPPTLRPGGVNPLSVLYGHYSRGIHGLSDDECLQVAQQLDFAMEYIFRNWRKQMEDAAAFRRTVQQWSGTATAAKKQGP